MRGKIAVLLIAATSLVAIAQEKSSVKIVPASKSNVSSGVEMFKHHCAACHGTDGQGHGPAAAALKVPPADLTSLARRNGGKFPELKVFNAIKGDVNVPAHGSKDMPVWGEVFGKMDSDANQSNLRFRNLTKYVESLQAK